MTKRACGTVNCVSGKLCCLANTEFINSPVAPKSSRVAAGISWTAALTKTGEVMCDSRSPCSKGWFALVGDVLLAE